MAKVAVIMGSKSDFEAVKPAIEVLKSFGVETDVRVISAHRTPDLAHDYAKSAEQNGVEVFICAAGKAAHLGGVIAAYTPLPVIGLPIKSLLAVQMLSLKYPELLEKMKNYKVEMAQKISRDDAQLQKELN